MVFQLKTPVVYDVAADDIGSLLTAPVPYGVYCRASVGYFVDFAHPWQFHSVGRDATFQQVYQDSRKRNYRIGPYHYFVQGGVAQQANCLIDYMKEIGISAPSGRYHAEFNPVLDVELECSGTALVGKPYADMLYQWIDMVEQAMQVQVDIYTAKPQWAYVLANGVAPEWIRGRRVWAKFYPYDDYIDRNVDFPPSYLPAGWTYDQVAFWQYCDHGRSAGHACNDLNKVTPAGQKYYDARIPGTIPAPETPPAPTVTVDLPAPGKLTVVDEKASVFTGTPNEVHDHFFTPTPAPTPEPPTEAPLVFSKTVTLTHASEPDTVTYFVLTVDPATHEITTDVRPWMTYPHVFAQRNGLEYAVNGGAGWNSTFIFGAFRYKATGFGAIGNSWQQLYIDKQGRMSLTKPLLGGIYTTFPFTNVLVKGGVVQPINKPIDYRARTAIGQRADGVTIILVVNGGDYNQAHGMSFQEVAQLMKDLGCVLAVMLDGGGSSNMSYIDPNGLVQILTTNDAAEESITINGTVYRIRPVGGHIGVKRKP